MMTREQAMDLAIEQMQDNPEAVILLTAIKSDCMMADWIIQNLLTVEQLAELMAKGDEPLRPGTIQ